MSTFLFDLDMTLVDTRRLATWRSHGMWERVKANLVGSALPFNTGRTPPHVLPAELKARGHSVGVVTSSPRWYAEALLAEFDVPYDTLVSFDDTDAHKPSPEPLTLAMEKLDADPARTFYVGDDPVDIEAAFHAGVSSIGAGWGIADLPAMSAAAPDLFLNKPGSLLKWKSLGARKYVGEVVARGTASPLLHWGSMIRCGGMPACYALGRYFKAADPRHAGHRLTELILTLKNDDSPASRLARAVAAGISRLDWTPDYIVPVPPKPSQKRNRFAKLLEALDDDLDEASVIIDGLRAVKEVDGYKSMGPLERAEACRDAFASDYRWDNDRVLIIDDVLTTGVTLNESARQLLARGAAEVRALVLGRAQNVFIHKTCPSCGRSMKVRSGPYGQFWGCTGYPNHCKYTANL